MSSKIRNDIATANLFAVRDDKVGVFLPPMTYRNEAEVCRVLAGVINGDHPHPLRDRTNEYSLFALGEFDDETGEIHPLVVPIAICNLITLKKNSDVVPMAPEKRQAK